VSANSPSNHPDVSSHLRLISFAPGI